MAESQPIGAPVALPGDTVLVTVNDTPIPVTMEVSTSATIGSEKRKRGRPPRGQARKPPPLKIQRVEEEEEEDVCFICFDGGSLVLCDRKGCPKAYHPACIKRDEAFFSSNAKWFCGWHICSVCQKASHYLCYTCTYSLCKGCIKNADYFCVRRNKGFCSMCMRTIMLIENKDQGNNGTVQVDFDDKGSWEYLFKLYWVYLKEKLSLTLSELTQAKNPWKESDRIHGELKYSHHVTNVKEQGSTIAQGQIREKQEAHGTNIFEKLGNRAAVDQAVKEQGSIMAQCEMSEKTDARETNILEKLGDRATVDQAVDGSGSETSIASLSTANSASTNISETDEVWHYRDPTGKMQGSFSMIQLRKWSKLGLFPLDMRIWTNDEYDDSVLLTDALNGLLHKAPLVHGKTSSRSQELGAASADGNVAERCGRSTGTGRECREMEVPCHRASKDSNGNAENARIDGLSVPFPKFLDLMNGSNVYSDKLQLCSPVPSSRHGEVHVALPSKERGLENVELHSAKGQVIQDSCGSKMCQITDSYNRKTQSNNQSYVGQSSGQNWGSSTSCRSSNNLDTGFVSGTNSKNLFEQKGNVNLPDRPSPTSNTSYDDIEAQAAEKLLSLSSGVPLRASDIHDWSTSTLKSYGEAKAGRVAENKASAPSKLSVQDSGPSWSSGSSLADERDGNTPTAEPSAEEWDSGLVSVSSLKPAEAVSDHVATPTPVADQLNYTSPSLQVSNLSNWQAAVNEPIEFSTLAEESVSDLLAEVDAMESQTQSGMGSPTSAMRFSEQMIPGYKNFILALFEDLSPTPDPAKSDGLSSNGDIKLPCQSPVTDELVGASQGDAFEPLKRSDGNSSNEQRNRN
ncbi:zinc finger CCCH domain-containing protein 44-like [Nicotiana tomentosiformis]|uniref:zinc finger CCCH domain-containing protein 44-like n=1 Tax=Nicotiana tomentosiformis TaxID=4098 RepID=UPI00051B3F52|nr:zinc finger CCCH domain-containing protein 44-like isoform X1 [Nicotiana tomentosiformis]XP_018622806.1 zinc finger CCCH domain-containing protein 44-like isoform X1 [Nicotiana tomentosiformis]